MSIPITSKDARYSSKPNIYTQVIISSDQESNTPVRNGDDPYLAGVVKSLEKQQDPTELQPITRQVDQEEENRKRQNKINYAVEQFKEIEMQKHQEMQEINKVLAKRASKQQIKHAERLLKKQFESHSYLPVSSLETIKKQLNQFQKLCKFELQSQGDKFYIQMRQKNRKTLTRGLLLTIEQIRMKVPVRENQSSLQIELLLQKTDTLAYCYEVAKKLQSKFFKNYFKSQHKVNKQQYQKQIKIVFKQFSDKNNLPFRRAVLNRTISTNILLQANQDTLKCQKTREEEKDRLLQLVRQSEKEPLAMHQMQEEQEPLIPSNINSLNSFSSYGNFGEQIQIEGEKQTEEQKEEREIKQRMDRSRKIYKKCEHSMKQHQQTIRNRMRRLKDNYQHYKYFMDLCSLMELGL